MTNTFFDNILEKKWITVGGGTPSSRPVWLDGESESPQHKHVINRNQLRLDIEAKVHQVFKEQKVRVPKFRRTSRKNTGMMVNIVYNRKTGKGSVKGLVINENAYDTINKALGVEEAEKAYTFSIHHEIAHIRQMKAEPDFFTNARSRYYREYLEHDANTQAERTSGISVAEFEDIVQRTREYLMSGASKAKEKDPFPNPLENDLIITIIGD